MSKIAVVTTAVGAPVLNAPDTRFEGADYFLFTDNPNNVINTKKWNVTELNLPFENKSYPNRRLGKVPKMLTHKLLPRYDYYIWHDFNFTLVESPEKIVSCHLGESDFAFFKHPHRDCWKQELYVVLNSKLDDSQILNRQLNYYESIGVKKNSGLYCGGVFVRSNSKISNEVCSLWFNQTSEFSSRDQISLPFCLQSLKPNMKILPGGIYNNKLVKKYVASLRMRGLVK